jgi:Kae1-associated kinase Bud32
MTKPKLIYRGAEAELWLDQHLGEQVVRKKRVKKNYKNPVLDERLRTERTRREAKLLRAARKAVNTPHVYDLSDTEITMEFIKGERVKEMFYSGNVKPAEEIGKCIRRLHNAGLVHNDLTTSNIIAGKNGLYFIDFGLGGNADHLEERATDLLVLKKMLSSTHYDVFEKVWPRVLKGYNAGKQMEKKIQEIEKRGRYL